MNFTTPCFVRVENPEKRKELTEWLRDLGRRVMAAPNMHLVAQNGEGVCLWMELEYHTDKVFAKEFIDCGENIKLFKALAAMNDENDLEQWFINDTYASIGCVMWHLCKDKKFKHYYVEWEDGLTDICGDFRKATAEEIVEYLTFTTRYINV